MTLHTAFTQKDNAHLRDVLYQHFKQQLAKVNKVTRSDKYFSAENELREFCDQNQKLDVKKMGTLWQMWCDMAKSKGAPLQPMTAAYVHTLDQNFKSAPDWQNLTDEAINKVFDEAMPVAPTAATVQQFTDGNQTLFERYFGRISFSPYPSILSSRAVSPSVSGLEQGKYVSGSPFTQAQRTASTQRQTQQEEQKSPAVPPASSTQSSPSAVSPALNHNQVSSIRNYSPSPISSSPLSSAAASPSSASSSSSSVSSLPSLSSSSSSSSTRPPNYSSRAGQSSTSPMTLPPSASSAPTVAASLSYESVNDRLMSHWPIYVLQNRPESQGFNIKPDGIIEHDASLTVSTENESSVAVERKSSAAEVTVTIPSQITMESNARMVMAARMATVAFFSNMPVKDIAKLKVEQMTIESGNKVFETVLKAAMNAYMTEMKKLQPSPQQNSSGHLAANSKYAVPQNQANHQYQRTGF